jgi:hypothetical protein
MSDTGSGWWASGHDGQWHEGDPPAGWVQGADGRWYLPAPPPQPPPPPSWPIDDDAPTQWDAAQYGDEGWDETQAYERTHLHPAPRSGWRGGVDIYRSWPRWARIAAPVSVALIALVGLGAAVGAPEDAGDEVEVADESTATAEETSTTEARVTTTAAPERQRRRRQPPRRPSHLRRPRLRRRLPQRSRHPHRLRHRPYRVTATRRTTRAFRSPPTLTAWAEAATDRSTSAP